MHVRAYLQAIDHLRDSQDLLLNIVEASSYGSCNLDA